VSMHAAKRLHLMLRLDDLDPIDLRGHSTFLSLPRRRILPVHGRGRVMGEDRRGGSRRRGTLMMASVFSSGKWSVEVGEGILWAD
jgi:hypothetical protein